MERNYEFKIGQKVRMWDTDEDEMTYGVVVDKTANTVFIKWTDMHEPVEHERDEFPQIKLGL